MKKVISAAEIKKRITELGKEITEFYGDGKLTVVAVMNGAVIFAADLMREISLDMYFDTVAVSSYEHLSSSGKLNFRSNVKLSVAGRHVLLIDDIFDTGFTAQKLLEHFMALGALSAECCCLLNKKDVVKKASLPRWCGFDIPDFYVVGYGLDADEKYRNLPDIYDFEN